MWSDSGSSSSGVGKLCISCIFVILTLFTFFERNVTWAALTGGLVIIFAMMYAMSQSVITMGVTVEVRINNIECRSILWTVDVQKVNFNVSLAL